MCSCSESALENEPEISFIDVNGDSVSWDNVEYQIIGVRLNTWYSGRDDIKFVVRGRP
jgi:hypothetical protein